MKNNRILGGEDSRLVFAQATTCTAAVLAILVVPTYQLAEVFLGRIPRDLLWIHAGWRTPVFVIALAGLALCLRQPGPSTVQTLLRLLAASVMFMMFGLFTVNVLHEHGDPDQMARGIIMATFAISLLSLKGGREVLVFFMLPFVMCLVWLAFQGIDWLEGFALLIDPLMMLIIGMIASELFYQNRRRQFALERELRRLASTDALTGLHNRRELEQRIAEEMSRSRRHGEPLSVVIGDLDHFKQVNDAFGHSIGDEVLRAVGERMRQDLRTEDLAVRWGGEEFLLMLPSTNLDQAVQVADKLRRAIAERPIGCNGREVPVTISLGAAELEKDEELEELIRRADDAMYRAKTEGRNRVCTY